MKKLVRDAFIHSASWFAMIGLVAVAMKGSEARPAAEVLCAWWAALYVGLLFDVRWSAALLLFPLAWLADAVLGRSALGVHRSRPGHFDFWMALWAAVRGLVFISPMVVNSVARRLAGRASR